MAAPARINRDNIEDLVDYILVELAEASNDEVARLLGELVAYYDGRTE